MENKEHHSANHVAHHVENKSSDEIKISKKVFVRSITAAIIVIIIAAILVWVFVSYLPHSKENSKVNSLKKMMLDNALCVYRCPLTNQTYLNPNTGKNTTGLIPDLACVNQCPPGVSAANITQAGLKTNDFLNDNFINDSEIAIKTCQSQAIITVGNSTIPQLDNVKFLSCAESSLSALKNKYAYLK